MEITIYTDGGCEPNPGKGAWAFVALDPYHEESGHEQWTTNNRMELIGAIKAIDHGISVGAKRINIKSDSQYVVKGYTDWMHGWKAKGWKRKSGWVFEAVKNAELWQALYRHYLKSQTGIIHIQLQWVRGHNGDRYNEVVDGIVRSTYEEVFGGKMTY